MKVGMVLLFQGTGPKRTDQDVYKAELKLGDLAEPLGFDSLWGVEHHFTDYTMIPDVIQYLTYFAGRTKHIELGTQVVVLPWHQPMRVAEQISMLDNLSGGRVQFAMGRGLGRVEFGGFGVDQNKSREIFVESAEMILSGLERGWCEYNGSQVKQERRDIRPRPFKSFKGRVFSPVVSPESAAVVAKLGLGLLIVPQKPWEQIDADIANYSKVYREVHNEEPPLHVAGAWVFCDKNAARAEELARKYIGAYYDSVVEHYELASDHLGKTKGYESYRAMQEVASTASGRDQLIDFFLSLQVYGTPDQVYERIVENATRLRAGTFTGSFSYGGMPYDEAERSLRLFASDVVPRLKQFTPKRELAA